MPRFVGKNTSATDYNVKSQSVPTAKPHALPHASTFDFTIADNEVPDIIAQLNGLSGVTYQQLDAIVQAQMFHLCGNSAPAAKGTTNIAGTLAANSATNPFTIAGQPDFARNLRVVFAASWDGGNVVVNGTDQNGNVIQETFVSAAGTTVVGVKVFKTVTSANKTAVGATANTASIGTGDKLGVPANVTLTENLGLEFVDGVAEVGTFDKTVGGVTPTTVPNGSHKYDIIVNV